MPEDLNLLYINALFSFIPGVGYILVIFSVAIFIFNLRAILITQVIVFLNCMPGILGSNPRQTSGSAVVGLS
jgi:Cu/Ag efflux pump CusA